MGEQRLNLKIARFQGEYRWLSNFWKVEIFYKGITYPTLEHAFQAQKTLDPADRAWIATADKPGEAKYRGSKVELRKDWEEVKEQIMFELLKIKFSEPELRRKLKETGDAELIEGNYWHDNYWGQCYCEKCYYKTISGFSQNKLGKMLMTIRKEMK